MLTVLGLIKWKISLIHQKGVPIKCDQMTRLFFNVYAYEQIFILVNDQSWFKALPNTKINPQKFPILKTPPKWLYYILSVTSCQQSFGFGFEQLWEQIILSLKLVKEEWRHWLVSSVVMVILLWFDVTR